MTHYTTQTRQTIENLKASIREILRPTDIHHACQEHDYQWRQRILGPVETIWMFALQVLHGNTACTHAARLLPGASATDTAYCQARTRLPLAVFQTLAQCVTRRLLRSLDGVLERWHGHRIFLIDGSTCSMSDTPELQDAFGQPRGQKLGCGFPMAKIVGLFHGGSGLLVDLLVEPLYTHEASIASRLFKWLRKGDILVGDRAFASFVILALLHERGVHAVMRQHQRRPVDFRRGRFVGVKDRVITLPKPPHPPRWMKTEEFERLPETLTVRQLEYRVEANGYRSRTIVLVTTLLDGESYPHDELAELYGERWEVETCYRHLKQTLGMNILRCRWEDGVRKELLMYRIVYNVVRALMVQSAVERGLPRGGAWGGAGGAARLSVIDTLRWLRDGPIDLDHLPLIKVNPYRPGRHQPRVVKRRPKGYSVLNRPRQEMLKAMKTWKL